MAKIKTTICLCRVAATVGLLGLGTLLTGCGGNSNDGDTETYEVELGYQGEAKTNPFLAAQRLCAEYGYQVSRGNSIVDLPSTSATVILPSDAIPTPAAAQLVADWVAQGGSLIYLLNGGNRDRNDFEGFDVEKNEDAEYYDHLLDAFEVSAAQTGNVSSNFTVLEQEFHVDIPSTTEFFADWAYPLNDPNILQGPFCEFSYGEGLVYVLSDGHPIRNRHIGENDHAAFFWAMMQSCNYTEVLFIEGRQISFLALLWSRAWMALIPLLVAVIIWLWKNLPRHGPIKPDEVVSEREFAKHVDALGHFLWQHVAVRELLAPIRRRLSSRLQATGMNPSSLNDEELTGLSERTGVPTERIREALLTNVEREPAQFVQISRDLQTLDDSL